MSIALSIATPADDASIRALLRRHAIPGRITISYERDPDFSIGCRATGDEVVVLVARDETRNIVAVACKSEREVFVNGSAMRLGYLGQLRIDQQHQGRWLLSRGFAMLHRLHLERPLPGYLAAVTSENREANGILIDRPRKQFPGFHHVAEYHTFALMTRQAREAEGVSAASRDDISEIVEFLRAEGSTRQFFPVWTLDRMLSLIRELGLRIEDLRIARRSGQIAGVMGLWDQSAYKQNVVRGYSGWMKVAAPIYNSAAPLIGRSRLPRPGERVRSAYAAFVCIARNDLAMFRELLASTLRNAAQRGLDFLLLGLDTRDPLTQEARAHPHILYRSQLYIAEWPEEEYLHARLDSRPSHVELATL